MSSSEEKLAQELGKLAKAFPQKICTDLAEVKAILAENPYALYIDETFQPARIALFSAELSSYSVVDAIADEVYAAEVPFSHEENYRYWASPSDVTRLQELFSDKTQGQIYALYADAAGQYESFLDRIAAAGGDTFTVEQRETIQRCKTLLHSSLQKERALGEALHAATFNQKSYWDEIKIAAREIIDEDGFSVGKKLSQLGEILQTKTMLDTDAVESMLIERHAVAAGHLSTFKANLADGSIEKLQLVIDELRSGKLADVVLDKATLASLAADIGCVPETLGELSIQKEGDREIVRCGDFFQTYMDITYCDIEDAEEKEELVALIGHMITAMGDMPYALEKSRDYKGDDGQERCIIEADDGTFRPQNFVITPQAKVVLDEINGEIRALQKLQETALNDAIRDKLETPRILLQFAANLGASEEAAFLQYPFAQCKCNFLPGDTREVFAKEINALVPDALKAHPTACKDGQFVLSAGHTDILDYFNLIDDAGDYQESKVVDITQQKFTLETIPEVLDAYKYNGRDHLQAYDELSFVSVSLPEYILAVMILHQQTLLKKDPGELTADESALIGEYPAIIAEFISEHGLSLPADGAVVLPDAALVPAVEEGVGVDHLHGHDEIPLDPTLIQTALEHAASVDAGVDEEAELDEMAESRRMVPPMGSG